MSVLREPLTYGRDEHISRGLRGGMWKKAGNPVWGLGGLKGGLWNRFSPAGPLAASLVSDTITAPLAGLPSSPQQPQTLSTQEPDGL